MISFITNTIDNPWTDNEICYFERYGSQRDIVQYNPYYNWRIKITDKNIFLCSLKTNDNDYKNIYLLAVTRRLFYFLIFIPQLEVIKQLSTNKQIKKLLSALPLISKCMNSSNSELNLNDDVLFLDGCCILIKVNAPIDSFLFPRNNKITNDIIKKQYALLNNLYFQFEREFDGVEKIISAYNTNLEIKIKKQQEKLKRFLFRKGIRLGMSVALAGLTGGLSVGIDAIFGLDNIENIQNVINNLEDVADIKGSTMDALDAFDTLDTGILEFSVDNMDNINIFDVGEGDDLLADSYNVSFGANHSDANIDRLYNPEIDRAYDKLGNDVNRINKGDVYPWENPSNTIKRDNDSIRYWERAKSEALAQSEIDQAKQDYWNYINDYCRERMNKKIHGA